MRYSAITVYKRQGEKWQRYIFRKAVVFESTAVNEESGGISGGGSICARLFSAKADIVEAGDRVVSGIGEREIPNKTLRIKEVRRNNRFGKGHIRITAG